MPLMRDSTKQRVRNGRLLKPNSCVRLPAKKKAVRVFTFLLLSLFFTAAAIFKFLPGTKAPEPLPGRSAPAKMIFRLEDAVKEAVSPRAPEAAASSGDQKVDYKFGIEDATSSSGYVRTAHVKVGMDYKVSDQSALGIEARRRIHDSQDAAAWGRSVEDENAAQAKYKLEF